MGTRVCDTPHAPCRSMMPRKNGARACPVRGSISKKRSARRPSATNSTSRSAGARVTRGTCGAMPCTRGDAKWMSKMDNRNVA